jgi:hypothetical protein
MRMALVQEEREEGGESAYCHDLRLPCETPFDIKGTQDLRRRHMRRVDYICHNS